MSAYEDYMSSIQQEDEKKIRLVSSLGEAASVNPDEFANGVKLARAAAIHLDALPHYKEEAQQAKLFGEVGLEKLWKDAPKTSEFLSHPDHAKMASDDTANLSGIERSFLDYGRDALVTAGKGAVGLPGAAVGLADVFAGGRVGKTLDSAGFRFNETQKILDTLYSPAQQAANSRVRSADGFVNTLQAAFENPSVIATTVGESLPQMLGGVGVSRGLLQIFPKLAPLFAGALGEGAIGAGSAAGQIRGETSDGLLTIKQQASAMASGAITAALGVAGGKAAQRMGIDDIDTALARGSAAPIDKKALLPKLAAAGFSEGVLEELPQSMQEQIWQNVALDKPLLEGVGNAGALGMLAGMVTGGAFSGLQHVTEKTNAQALDAERGAGFIETLNKFIGASTTLQRDPETFEKFITQATENGPVENIYINAQTLQQSGISGQLAQVSPAIAEQFQAAIETGGDIRIPVAEYASKIAPTEFAQSLVDHLKVDENGFSRIEAQEYMQTQGAELQGHIERIMAENEGDATFKASVDAVKENIRSQLDTANRFPSQNNEAFSTLTATFFAVTAARVGMTPEALYAKYPLRVVAESIAGGNKFDQNGVMADKDTVAGTQAPTSVGDRSTGSATIEVDGVLRSTLNSNGKPIHPTQEGVRNFWRWFGDSKVIDADGRPLVVYHGTTSSFDSFSFEKLGNKTEANSALGGFFFAESHRSAETYATVTTSELVPVEYRNTGNSFARLKENTPDNVVEIVQSYIGKIEESSQRIIDELMVAVYGSGVDEKLNANAASELLKKYDNDASNAFLRGSSPHVIAKELFGISLRTYSDVKNYEAIVREIATKFANYENAGNVSNGASVMPVYLKIERFATTDVDGLNTEYAFKNINSAIRRSKKSGKDGVVIKNITDGGPKTNHYVVFDNKKIKSAIGNSGSFGSNVKQNEPSASAGSDVLNQFAGQSAATADTHALATAQQRLKAGEDADTVRKETGWFIGVDGKWRYEIDDSGATLKKPYPENGALWVDVWKSRLMSGDSSTVGKMLDHPALFSAYPALADIAVSAKQGSGASYSARSRQIDIGEDVPMYEVISMLLHEIQHGIQTIEGFATGGSSAEFAKKSNEAMQMIIAHNSNMSRIVKEMDAAKEAGNTAALTRLKAEYDRSMDMRDQLRELATQDPHEQYKRLAGEVEARNTQTRQNMTDAERRNASPESTQDVANSDVIVVFNGKEMASAPALANASTVKARGNFNPATLQMSLLKSADLSTFLHESGHFFLEVQFDLAAQLQQDANIHGADTLKEGEQEYLRDTQTVLDWFGIKDLAEWNNLDFEEKRSYHERYAESFESYLFTGKAPSIELAPLFQKFRAFLTSVYTSLKNFLSGHPEAGKLTDEVRGVFDRMLATNEQILLAEQARSMMPLFDANDGTITPEEYANLQALGIAGTNQAIQELQAKGLRDLQWARNAKSRELRRLQRDSKSIREELTMQARREIMSHPVYQAWSFLTKKLSRDDMTDLQQTRAKSDPYTVDETQDSLFAAIAKLGGINKRELVETWGIDPADKAQSGVFGKFVMRAEDKGLSIDGIVESLSQYGYLKLDENGKADMRELEEKFKSELAGDTQYSNAYDYSADLEASPIANPKALGAGRLSLAGLSEMDLPPEMINHLKALRMTAKDGLHPDMVAEVVGDFGSGDEMVRAIVAAKPPKEAIAERAQELMLQNHGELATPEAIDLAADKAIHNEVRARAVEAELNALAKATNQREATGNLDKNGKPITRPVLATAAREFAAQMIGRLKVRDIKPSQYANSEAKAARAADKAKKAGDVAQAMAEKRNQLINLYLTRAAYAGQDEAAAIVRYLSKFDREGTRKALANDYLVQIDAILERFDLRKGQSLKAIDKRESLAKFIERQVEAGIEPEIPDWMVLESNKTHYKNLTLDELRAVNESVRQIEHLGRLKNKLLTAKDARELAAIVEEISASMIANHPGEVNNEVRNEIGSKIAHAWRGAMAAHRKAASIVREMDGFKDGGPMWEYFIRPMNEAGDREASMRADAAEKLHTLAKPVMDAGKLGGKGKWFQALGRNLNRGEIIAMALNIGNESNLQRLLGGKSWTVGQIKPALDTLTATDWAFVQGVWDFFESYRPEIGAKQMRVYGTEPDWIEPGNQFLQMLSAEKGLSLRGGYYPVKYDPRQSGKSAEFDEKQAAQDMMRAANTAATTRRSFTKSRVEEVKGRPLLLTFDGIWQGANEVIHDLTWHEWLIDANRLMRRLDDPMREHYGSEAVNVLRTAIKDSAQGDMPATNAIQRGLNHARIGATVAGLGWNLTTSLLQPIGLTNSVVRIGAPWVARGLREFYSNPLAKAEEVQAKSEFMLNRGRTFMREINDVRNRLESDKGAARSMLESSYFILIQKMQATVDYPTWFGAYLKALDGGNDEARSVSLADQAVIDSQGGGQIKDLAEVQRGHPMMKLFTNFYSFFSVVLNLSVERTKATNFKSPAEVAALAGDYLLLLVLPSAIGAVLKSALKGGDDDEEKLMKKIAEEQIGFLMGLFVGLREMTSFAQMVAGVGNPAFGYSGPAGARLFAEMQKLGQQINQGEADMALFKAANSTAGILFHYPSGQVNRAVEGTAALIDGRTNNPLAPLVGPPPKN